MGVPTGTSFHNSSISSFVTAMHHRSSHAEYGLSRPRHTPSSCLSDWIAPVRIDFVSEITGVQFAQAWKNRVAGTLFGDSFVFISLEDLTLNKQILARDIDLEQLKRLPKQK